MTITFEATSFFNDRDDDVIYGSLQAFIGETQQHYLNFQRNLEPDDHDGIYLEYDGQENGGFNLITACELTRSRLVLHLSQSPGLLPDAEGFDLALQLDDDTFQTLSDFLRDVFRGYEALLRVR